MRCPGLQGAPSAGDTRTQRPCRAQTEQVPVRLLDTGPWSLVTGTHPSPPPWSCRCQLTGGTQSGVRGASTLKWAPVHAGSFSPSTRAPFIHGPDRCRVRTLLLLSSSLASWKCERAPSRGGQAQKRKVTASPQSCHHVTIACPQVTQCSLGGALTSLLDPVQAKEPHLGWGGSGLGITSLHLHPVGL